MSNNINFPQYRKYPNNKVFFKIISENEWEEVHHSAGKYTLHSFTANILPDRNYIKDMLYHYQPHWQPITETEYVSQKQKCVPK